MRSGPPKPCSLAGWAPFLSGGTPLLARGAPSAVGVLSPAVRGAVTSQKEAALAGGAPATAGGTI